MSDLVVEAIKEITSATRRISEGSAHSSTRVIQDGDNFSFSRPESGAQPGLGLGRAIVERLTRIKTPK